MVENVQQDLVDKNEPVVVLLLLDGTLNEGLMDVVKKKKPLGLSVAEATKSGKVVSRPH